VFYRDGRCLKKRRGPRRAVTGAGPAAVQEAAEALRARGFINYFGLQRFGSGSSGTHRRALCAGPFYLAPVCCRAGQWARQYMPCAQSSLQQASQLLNR